MAEPQFNKQPTQYAPFAGAGNMGDPMSLAMMMFLPQALNAIGGPGKFLPSQSPSQGPLDGYMAYRYQQDTFANTLDAATQGNERVSTQLGGLMRLLTGQKPNQMNKEQQDFFAGIVNNPIAKVFLGQAIGPENMEGVLFGTRGDPSALAATVNRIGAFRRGPTGGRDQMNAQQLQQFTKGMHETLYGTQADVNDMHGFMAGQTGQLMEHLFQRGELPQSIGMLTPAERARMVSGQIDDKAVQQVAREFGRSDLMAKDKTFAAMTPEAQERELDKRMDDYSTRIKDTLTKVRDIDTRDMGPEERDRELGQLERSEEYKALASRVDSKRVGETLKQYTGAVSAVREIFGDNGNPNAPMGALLAALEQLSGGATSQMRPQKVEATLREMRLAAKEVGVGMEQMMGFAGQMSATGDTLGIAKPLSLQNTRNALTMVGAMEATGAFEGNRFGSLTKAEALQEVGQRMQRGEVSPVGKTLAAAARAVAENPDKYRGTEIEAMVNAYNDPNSGGVYTFKGETRNLYEMAGRGGPQAIASKFAASGGNERTLEAYYYDKGTQEFQQAGAVFETQKYEMQRTMAVRMNSDIYSLASNDQFDAAARTAFGSATDEEFSDDRDAFTQNIANDLAQQLATEGAALDQKDRPRFLQERAKASVVKALRQQNPALTEAQADQEAEKLVPLMFGSSYGDRRDAFARMASNVNAELEDMTNMGLTGNASIYNATPEARRRAVITANKAKRLAAANRGHESTLAARIGDALNDLGSGKDMSITDVIQQVTGMTDVKEMLERYAPELAPALEASARQRNDAEFSQRELQSYVDAATGEPNNQQAVNNLKRLALTDADAEYVDDAEIQRRLGKRDIEDLRYTYDSIMGKENASAGKSKEELVREISQTSQGRAGALTGAERSRTELEQRLEGTKVISSADVRQRLADTEKYDDDKIAEMYKKYSRGTATKREDQIRELSTNIDAVAGSGVLGENEMSIEQLADLALRREGGAAGLTPEEIARNRVVMRQVENVQAGLTQGSDTTLVETGATEALRMVLGDDVTPEMIEAMTQVTRATKGSKEDETNLQKLRTALSGKGKDQVDEVMRYAQAFRDAKDVRLDDGRLDKVTEDNRRNENQRQAQEDQQRRQENSAQQTTGSWLGGLIDSFLGSPQEDKRRQERAKNAQSGSVTGTDQIAQESARQATRDVQAQRGGGSGNGGEKTLEVSGTLRVENLYQVMLAARGNLPEETPGDGGPVYTV